MRLFLALLLVFSLWGNCWADKIEIPALAYKLRSTVIREVRFWWSFDEPTSTFHSQIHQESRWNPGAKSPVGASGLAQFMPATADWISNLYPKELGGNQPLDVKWAIRALVTYDKWLYDRIDSDERWPMTLSSYNGGLGNLRKDQILTKEHNLNQRKWWNNVELYSKRSSPAFRENRDYPRRILLILKPTYEERGF